MIQIRHFAPGDGTTIKKLVTGIMDTEFPDDKAAFSFEDLDTLQDSYGSLGETFFVAGDGKKIVGTIGVKREDDRVALIRRIFVLPEYRGKKIGQQLLNRAIEFCGEVGYQHLVFKATSKMTGAIELFKKSGFQSRVRIPMGSLELLKLTMPLNREILKEKL